MKKRISLVMVLVLVLAIFVACGPQTDTDAEKIILVFTNGNDTEVMEIVLSELQIELKPTTKMDEVLNALKEKKGVNYVASSGFISSIHTLNPNQGKNEYISLYSSIDDEDVKAVGYGDERVANGATVYTTGVGINELPIRDNATYLFIILTW